MKTAINGKVRIKIFWGCAYSGGGMTPVQRLFKIGNLLVYKVVYSKGSSFTKEYYKPDVIEKLKGYFDVRWEETTVRPQHGEEFWYALYSYKDGGYIGRPEDAYRLLQKGIRDIQKAQPNDSVCSIGFHPKEKKWYGWSHRALFGFGIGDVVKEGDCTNSSGFTEEYLKEHPEENMALPVGFTAKTLLNAKRMAIAFAESVS